MGKIYNCKIIHHRHHPKSYRFIFRFLWFYLDLDKLEKYSEENLLFSHNRLNLFSFYDCDHSLIKGKNTKEYILRYLRSNNIFLEVKSVHILTMPRLMGYVFNPVSYYFIEFLDGKRCCVISICNTYKEVKTYLAGSDTWNGDRFKVSVQKNFYISPFTELDNQMDFNIRWPVKDMAISINDFENKKLILNTVCTGHSRPLNNIELAFGFFKFPIMTLSVIMGIHWHALILYLKKIPYKQKKDDLHLQQGATPWRP